MSRRKVLIGEALLESGAVTSKQLEKALEQQKVSGQLLGDMLVEQGVITPGALVNNLAQCMGIRGVQLRHGLIDPKLITLIGEEEAERMLVVPMFKVHGTLTIAMAEPSSLPTLDRLRMMTGCQQIRPVLALEANIREFLKKYSLGAFRAKRYCVLIA